MHPRPAAIATILMLAAAGAPRAASAQTAPPHEIPQSSMLQNESQMIVLEGLSKRPGPLGAAAQKVKILLEKHHAREAEYILPPLTLLGEVARGHVTPDMRWAIDMGERVRRTEGEIFAEDAALTDALSAMLTEAQIVNDKEAVDFAHEAVADTLADQELHEPMTIVLGDYLRLKLGNAK
jgi:hypothetical protein